MVPDQPSQASIDYFAGLHETPAFGAAGFDFDGLRQGMGSRREPEDLSPRYETADIDGIPGEWVCVESADPDVRLLYLHGGGFISGTGAYYAALAARLSEAAGCAVLLLDYRLAPEFPFPAGLEDCARGFEWMRKNGPVGASSAASTFITGDSAGGGLTLSTLLLLRDRGRALPTAAAALSPFADLTLTGESLESEAANDPIMAPQCLPEFVNLYLAGADPRDPLASPAFGDYTGLPPLLIQVGEHEIIRTDSERAAKSAKDAGVDVTLEVWPGMWHVFQSHEPLLPEGKQAIRHIASFVKALTR